MKDRTLQQQKSGRYFTAIDSAGIVVPLSSGTGLRTLAVYAQSARLHWRTGGGDLVASDVQTYTQTTTAADPTIGVDQWEYIPLRETDTHIGFRAASGSAILNMFLLVDSPIDYYTDVVAPLGDVVAHWSGVASEYLIDRTGTSPAYLEGTWTVEDSLVKGGSNLAGFDGATARATAAVLDGDFALARDWIFSLSGWSYADNVANSNVLHPIAGNSLSFADPGATLYFEDRNAASSNQSVRAYFSRGDSIVSTVLVSGEYLVIPDGKIHHAAVVGSGSSATLYYDGIPAAHTDSLIATNAVDSDWGLSIGYGETSSASEFFSELSVGEVTLFSAAKTDADILTLYSEGGGQDHYYKQCIDLGAIHLFPLENGSLDVVTKVTGTESSGSQSNIRPLGRRMGQSAQFTGSGSWSIANVDIDLTLGASDNWTILTMARIDSFGSPVANIGLFGIGTTSTTNHAAIFTIGTAVTGRIRDGSSNTVDGGDLSVSVPTIKTDDLWRMYALVMDRDASTAYLYVVGESGTLVDSAGDTSLGALTPTGSFIIGDNITATSWDGQIAGTAIFQRALSQAEVESLYAYANVSEFVLGIPKYSDPLAMYDSRVVHEAGGNTNAWPDASGVRSTATILNGTPGYSATGGPGGGPAVTFGGAECFDAGATPVFPAGAAPFTVYALVSTTNVTSYLLAQITLTSGNGRAGFGYSTTTGHNMFFGNDVDDPSISVNIGHLSSAWAIVGLAVSSSESLTFIDEAEASDIAVPNSIQQTGVLIGAVTNSPTIYNGGIRQNFYDGSMAHISVWEGYHNEAQRASVRAFIRKQHGI